MPIRGMENVRRLMLQTIPQNVVDAAEKAVARESVKLVQSISRFKPIMRSPYSIEVDWMWGTPFEGNRALKSGRGGSARYVAAPNVVQRRLFTTVYAMGYAETGRGAIKSTGRQEFPAIARWMEFGTRPRRHKSGKYTGFIPAQPYFYPVYNMERTKIRRRIAQAIRLQVKKAGKQQQAVSRLSA